jgi:signal transduction histidine kinase
MNTLFIALLGWMLWTTYTLAWLSTIHFDSDKRFKVKQFINKFPNGYVFAFIAPAWLLWTYIKVFIEVIKSWLKKRMKKQCI